MSAEPTDSPATPKKRPPRESTRQRRARIAAAKPAPVTVLVCHRVRGGREQEFLDLLEVLRPMVTAHLRNAGGGSWSLLRNRTSTDDFVEVFWFPNETVREEFDALHVVDRKTAAVMVLLEEVVVDEAADYRLYEPVVTPPTRTASATR